MKRSIYLDYNATAPLRTPAREAMLAALDTPLNASSVHGNGREGRKLIEKARVQIADALGIPAGQVIFNSGATEANNTVLNHFKNERILISAIEHPSVLEAAPQAEKIPVTGAGLVDLPALEKMLQQKTGLVSVMLVNNETGVIQPIREIAVLAHRHGALIHCDGAQALGRMPVNMNELGIDFLSLSSHKVGGMQGVGALALGLCGITPVLLTGGGQEKKARAGTENIAGIAAFGAAVDEAMRYMNHYQQLGQWRDKLENDLKEISPSLVFHGQDTKRVANTSMFSLPGASSETLLMALDLEGFAVSNGSACSSGTVRASHVLTAMGYDKDIAGSGIRISLGWENTQEDIGLFAEAWKKIVRRFNS